MDATDSRLARFASIKDQSRRTYAAMLTALDEGVGKVIEKVRAAGLEQDTLVVFLSDNGGPTMLGTTINGSKNDPFRGSKRTTLEGGIRVPFVLRWKGRLPGGAVYDQPVIQLDLLPTILVAAGAPPKAEGKLDGVSLLPYVKGEATGAPHEALYWRLGEQSAIRRGDWKLVRYDRTVDEAGARSNPQAGIKVTVPRLYNLARDPGEAEDLASSHPEKVQELLAAWRAWESQLARPLWGPARRTAAAW
jgi:arylsulfatase A-like enzyme